MAASRSLLCALVAAVVIAAADATFEVRVCLVTSNLDVDLLQLWLMLYSPRAVPSMNSLACGFADPPAKCR